VFGRDPKNREKRRKNGIILYLSGQTVGAARGYHATLFEE
jgi:hypothetical protein